MPSQVFDDGYGVYEVPSGDRLVFKGGEGADASYNIPSTFAKAASPARVSRSSAMGSADRFTSPGSYLRKPATAAVGPGSYTASPPSRPSSRYGPWGPEVNEGNVLATARRPRASGRRRKAAAHLDQPGHVAPSSCTPPRPEQLPCMTAPLSRRLLRER